MVNTEALFFPTSYSPRAARIVPDRISAIQLTTGFNDQGRLGAITQLPQSAPLEICGEGFNDRTVKVRCRDCFYFVFREDLEILTSSN